MGKTNSPWILSGEFVFSTVDYKPPNPTFNKYVSLKKPSWLRGILIEKEIQQLTPAALQSKREIGSRIGNSLVLEKLDDLKC